MSLMPRSRDGYYDEHGVWHRTKFCFVDCGAACTCKPPGGLWDVRHIETPLDPKPKEPAMNDFPRRGDLKRMTTAEIKIREAMLAVEEMGADERLTRAVTLLGDARDAVADYVDGQQPCANPATSRRDHAQK